MPNTTIKQKILLVFFGILTTCIVLEVGLRAGGFIFTLSQERGNVMLREDGEFRILCIGESTTALGGQDSYPFQLEKILNEREPRIRFRVINKGRVSKNTGDLLEELDGNLKKYKPNLVVALMGINDAYFGGDVSTTALRIRAFLRKSRVYKLFELICAHIYHKIQGTDEVAEKKTSAPIDEELIDEEPGDIDKLKKALKQLAVAQQKRGQIINSLKQEKRPAVIKRKRQQLAGLKLQTGWLLSRVGRYYRLRKQYDEAEKYFRLAIIEDSNNSGTYIEWGRLYKDQKQCKKAIVLFNKAVEINPKTILALMESGRCYNEIGLYGQTFRIYKSVFEKNPRNPWIYSEIGKWFKAQGHYAQAEEVYLKVIEQNPKDYFLYEQLADVYAAQGNDKKAQMFYAKVAEGTDRAQRYLPFTVQNYNAVADSLRLKGIPLVCMQYPLRSIKPLKDILWSHKQLVFVENRENFEEGLQSAEYSKYFSDNFAGDFGHCTRLGNRLIAENLATAILGEIIKK